MADVTDTQVKDQASTLTREDRKRLIDDLSQGLQAEEAPRKNFLDYAGAIPWDGRDIDERIRLLREEWDERAERLGY